MLKLTKLFLLVVFSVVSIVAQTSGDKQKELIDKSLKLFQQGQIDEAISINKEAIEELRKSSSAKPDIMMTALVNGAFMKKVRLEREEKTVREKLQNAPRKPSVAPDITAYDIPRNTASEAENNLREALEISQTTNQQETLLAATIMRDLALILQKNYYPQEIAVSRKRIDEATELLTKAITIQEKTLGETHEKTLQTFFDLITLYNRFDSFVKLSSLIPEYLANAEKKYGQNAKELLPVLRLQASNFYTLKRDDELKPILQKIKQIEPQAAEAFPIKEISFVRGRLKLPRIPTETLPSGKSQLNEEVLVEIDENGRATQAKANSNLDFRFRQALEEAARQTEYIPIKFNGNPVKARGKIVYRLNLRKESLSGF